MTNPVPTHAPKTDTPATRLYILDDATEDEQKRADRKVRLHDHSELRQVLACAEAVIFARERQFRELESTLAAERAEKERAIQAFTDLRKADQATMTEMLAGGIEQMRELAAERASLKAMTADRDLWRYEHEGDCPVQALLNLVHEELEEQKRLADGWYRSFEAARASRLQAEEALKYMFGITLEQLLELKPGPASPEEETKC